MEAEQQLNIGALRCATMQETHQELATYFKSHQELATYFKSIHASPTYKHLRNYLIKTKALSHALLHADYCGVL